MLAHGTRGAITRSSVLLLSSAIVLMTAALPQASETAASDSVLLRFAPREGQHLTYVMVFLNTMDTRASGSIISPLPGPQASQFDYMTTYNTQIQRLQVSPRGDGTYACSSSRRTIASGADGRLARSGGSLPLLSDSTAIVSAQGEWTWDMTPSTGTDAPQGLTTWAAMETRAVMEILGLWWRLPEQRVRVGEAWRVDRTVPVSGQSLDLKGKRTVTRFIETSTGPAAKIEGEFEIGYTQPSWSLDTGTTFGRAKVPPQRVSIKGKMSSLIRHQDGVLLEGRVDWDTTHDAKMGLFARWKTAQRYAMHTSLLSAEEAEALSAAAVVPPVAALAFSPDGSVLMTGTTDAALLCLDAATGELLRTLVPPSPSGGRNGDRQLISIGCDNPFTTIAAGYAGERPSDSFSVTWRFAGPQALRSPDVQLIPTAHLVPPAHIVSIGALSWAFSADPSDFERQLSRGQLRGHGTSVVGLFPDLTGSMALALVTRHAGLSADLGQVSKMLAWTWWPYPMREEGGQGSRRPAYVGGLDLMEHAGDTGIRESPSFAEHRSTRSIAFSRNCAALAYGDVGGDLAIFRHSARRGKIEMRITQELRGHLGPVTAVAWSADGATLVSSGFDGCVHVWNIGDPGAREPLHTIRASLLPVTCAAISPDGRYVAAGTSQGVKVWDLAHAAEPRLVWQQTVEKGAHVERR